MVVTDREGDIYDFLAWPRRPGDDLLVRAAHNRRVNHPEKYLWDAVGSADPVGTMKVDVPRGAHRPPRLAELTLRVSRLGVHPPRYRKHEPGLEAVFVDAVLAQEENPPPGQEAIGWLLLTTLPVTKADEAGAVRGVLRAALACGALPLRAQERVPGRRASTGGRGSAGAGVGPVQHCGVASSVSNLRGPGSPHGSVHQSACAGGVAGVVLHDPPRTACAQASTPIEGCGRLDRQVRRLLGPSRGPWAWGEGAVAWVPPTP